MGRAVIFGSNACYLLLLPMKFTICKHDRTTIFPTTKPMNHIYEKTYILSYQWECDEIEGPLPSELTDILDDEADGWIAECVAAGSETGEILSDVDRKLPGRETPEGGFHCYCYWSLTETTKHGHLDNLPVELVAAAAMEEGIDEETKEHCIDSALERLTPETLDIQSKDGKTTFAGFLVKERPKYVEENMETFPAAIKARFLATLLAAKS